MLYKKTKDERNNMLFFKKQLETKTKDKIKVELFFSGVLGNERELMDLVATGVLQGTRGGFLLMQILNLILLLFHFL